ncbi:MAG: SH3 domain-containing protein, partial [Campylobacter concisus]
MVKHFLFIALLVLNLFAVNTDEVSVFDMMDEAREDKFVNSPTSNPKTQKPPKEQDFSRKFVSPQPERITPEQMRNIVPTNEPDISVPDNQVYDKIKVKELLLKATNVPKNVVIGEIFSVEIVADTQNDFEFEFETQLDETNIKWLNKKNFQWVKSEDNKYVGTFYLEATSIDAKTLKVSLTLKRNGENYQSSSINIFLPKLKELRSDENYNHIVADNLEVKKFKTTKFDDINNIMVVEIYGNNV